MFDDRDPAGEVGRRLGELDAVGQDPWGDPGIRLGREDRRAAAAVSVTTPDLTPATIARRAEAG
jgi:hypothetical protein